MVVIGRRNRKQDEKTCGVCTWRGRFELLGRWPGMASLRRWHFQNILSSPNLLPFLSDKDSAYFPVYLITLEILSLDFGISTELMKSLKSLLVYPHGSLLLWVLENLTFSSGSFISLLRFMVTIKHSYQKVTKVIPLCLKQCIQKGVTSVWHSGGWQTVVTLLTELTPEGWKDQYFHVPVSLLCQAHRMESFYHPPLRKYLNPDSLKLYGLDVWFLSIYSLRKLVSISFVLTHVMAWDSLYLLFQLT